jgi:selenocysteine lyase/cysteine desulfurase
VDTSQTAGVVLIDVERMGIDVLATAINRCSPPQ